MKIFDIVNKTVCFVGRLDGKEYVPLGTGFFISKPGDGDAQCVYVVTAKHVIAEARQNNPAQKIYVRVNTEDQKNAWRSIHIADWKCSVVSSVDVAIAPAGRDILDNSDCHIIPISKVATETIIQELAIGIGDDVFFSGCFVGHEGNTRICPTTCKGSIASMPKENVKVGQEYIRAYLINAPSIGGMSGSPVFVVFKDMEVVLLGLLRGCWSVPNKGSIYTDISLVVPGEKILSVFKRNCSF